MTDRREEEEAADDIDVFERADANEPALSDGSWVALPPSGMLTIEDADALLRWRPASLIAVVGERNGGKTTLITELYDRFLRGNFAGVQFAHSLSLIGFEKKSFQSRAESGTDMPDTPRTSAQDGLTFFHLGVSTPMGLNRTDLLISERAGEAYRDVRDKPDDATKLVEITKADVVLFIVDGERVADHRRRAEAFASVRDILRALTERSAFAQSTSIQIVTTKCDLLEGEGAVKALAALTDFENSLAAKYDGQFTRFTAFRTAARDPTGKSEAAFGLAPLLMSWLEPKLAKPEVRIPFTPELDDEFDRLLLRRDAQ